MPHQLQLHLLLQQFCNIAGPVVQLVHSHWHTECAASVWAHCVNVFAVILWALVAEFNMILLSCQLTCSRSGHIADRHATFTTFFLACHDMLVGMLHSVALLQSLVMLVGLLVLLSLAKVEGMLLVLLPFYV